MVFPALKIGPLNNVKHRVYTGTLNFKHANYETHLDYLKDKKDTERTKCYKRKELEKLSK